VNKGSEVETVGMSKIADNDASVTDAALEFQRPPTESPLSP
jgi:hypothetical protein